MRVLAIEPYYGGSHRAFLDGWIAHSRHRWTKLTFSPHHWKWRVRHTAIDAAAWLREQTSNGQSWDAIFCSTMFDLATFRGLAGCPPPAVLYFHENQLTYPNPGGAARDLHFGITNWTSALSAEAIWFNSHFHQADWEAAIAQLLARMPKTAPLDGVTPAQSRRQAVADKSSVQPPGINALSDNRPANQTKPLSLVWAARWEHDKRPDRLLDIVERLTATDLDFRLHVLGQSFDEIPPSMQQLKERFGARLGHWGTADELTYRTILEQSDIFLSTADHEFFGVAAVEAMSGGCYPVLPNRLAYPELVAEDARFLYDHPADAASKIAALAATRHEHGRVWGRAPSLHAAMQRFSWPVRAPAMDDAIQNSAN